MRFLLVSVLLSGCVLNSNKWKRPRELESSWFVSKPRLLGVRSDPAEARPGDTVRFSALIADPDNEIGTVLWLACPVTPGSGGIGFGCTQGDQEVIGVEPLQPPIYQAPIDFLDSLSPEERSEGRYVNVQVTGLPPIDPADLQGEFDFEDIDFNQVEAGYKRTIISEADTPNTNPEIEFVTSDGEQIDIDTPLLVDADTTVEIGVALNDSVIERYRFVNRDGEVEFRIEEPYVTWYSTAGRILEPFTLYPFTQSNWQTPEQSGTVGSLWAVVRDRRGGQTWTEITFLVR